MRRTESSRLATMAGGELRLPEGVDGHQPVGPGVVVDARKASAGSVFVAIPGERVDGHDFTGQAAEKGAAAVLGTRMTDAALPHVLVDDPVQGLSELARSVVAAERDRGMVAVAVTGSSGKTSTKDLLAQVLEAAGPTVSPVGSFNNEIGVPLTACGIDRDTRFLVSEMGARGLGHIAWLCSIVEPDVSMVLNVGTAHLGEFGSREGIAQAKGEIYEALGRDGWAVLNADDELVSLMAPRVGNKDASGPRAHLAWWTRTGWQRQGGSAPAGELFVSAVEEQSNALQQYSFTLVVERDGASEQYPVQLQVMGAHQVSNALAAATAAIAAGLAPQQVAEALSAATTRSRWRMELQQRADGLAVLNDAYNANPDSMAVSLAAFGQIATARRTEHPGARAVAVLGDMLELGEQSDELHRQVGRRAVEAGVDEVVAVGQQAPQIVEGAQAAGGRARVCARDEVAASLDLAGQDVVLVKASRGIALEKVADALLAVGTGEVVGDGSSSSGEKQ